jgi:membrane-associated phospholipid phosphatase
MISVRLAAVITHVFNPPVVAAFTFLILLYSRSSISPPFVAVSLTFGTFVPLAVIYLLLKRGVVSDFSVSEKKERAKPFAGAVSSYIIGSLMLWWLGAPLIVTALMLCYAGNTVLMMLITRHWKISVHTSGIAGPTTVLIENLGVWVSILFALLIPVGWARIKMKAHTPTQVVAGALVTIASTWLQLKIYLALL